MKLKILVLGSAGQIGKPTCNFLRNKGYDVLEYDIKNNPKHDLRNQEAEFISKLIESDFVYYFASDVGGAKYLEQHEHTYRFISDNMQIMINVFNALNLYKKPFIFTSSQMSELQYSSYGILKKLGERMTNDIGGLVVRLWNVYGPETDEEKSHVVTDFCKMAKQNKIIKMRTDGTESRQLLHADDCAECLLTLTTNYDNIDKNKNYHITSFQWVSIMDVAKHIQNISGCDIIQGISKDKTQMNAMNSPDTYILNFWKPKISLEQGIEKIYNETI